MSASVPILDPRVACDALLDARSNLKAVRDSAMPGTPLYAVCLVALNAVDSGLVMVRALIGTKAA